MEKLYAGSNTHSDTDPALNASGDPSKSSDDSKSDSKMGARGGSSSGLVSGGGAGGATNPANKPHIEVYLKTFMHAVHCRNANCTFAKCIQFKRVVQHSKQCVKYKTNQCDYCRQLIALCIYHAKSCKDDSCQVPFCSSIKLKLKQQKALNSQAERRRMLMMNKTLRNSANHHTVQMQQPQSPGEDGTKKLTLFILFFLAFFKFISNCKLGNNFKIKYVQI